MYFRRVLGAGKASTGRPGWSSSSSIWTNVKTLMKYFQHQKLAPASNQQGKLRAGPEASRPWQRWQHRKQPAVQTHRQVQDAVHQGPVGGTESEEKVSLRHPVMSEKLPDEHSWDRNTTVRPRPSHAIKRESTRNAAPAVPHHSPGSRNSSAEEALGRTDNSSVRRRKQQNEAAPTPRPSHHTNNLVLSLGPQGDGADSVKGACTCPGSSVQVQDPHSHQLALAQKGAIAKRPHETRIPTPRTEEAVWAAAALVFLFVLLTLAVLYTRLYRNFRRSQSLYWDLGSDREGQESVASVIKRRLLSRQSRRKRWQKQRQPPLLLHESGSESSE